MLDFIELIQMIYEILNGLSAFSTGERQDHYKHLFSSFGDCRVLKVSG